MKGQRFLLAAALAITAIVGLGAYVTRSPSPKKPLTIRTDRAPLTKRFPFLGNFERCSWVGGVADDRSKGWGVPAPSSYFIRAYVVLKPDDANQLLERYEWTDAHGETIPEPDPPLGEGFPKITGPFRKSEELIRRLPSLTTYARGTILFQPGDRLLYLDLVND